MRNLKGTMAKTCFGVAIIVSILVICPLTFAQTEPAENPASAQTAPVQTPPSTLPAPVVKSFPKVQVFGGYSFLYADSGRMNGTNFDVDLGIFPNTLEPRTSFNGWSAEGQYNFSSWVGGAVDVSGFQGFPFVRGLNGTSVSGFPSASSYSILAGPVISYRKWKQFTPYAHALFGWNRQSVGASTLTGVSAPVSSTATTFNDFVISPGVGVDYNATRHVALRLAQIDWFHTSLNLNSFHGTVFNTTLIQGFKTDERNWRFSAGIVVKF